MAKQVPQLAEEEANDIIRAISIAQGSIVKMIGTTNDFYKRLNNIKEKLLKTWEGEQTQCT